MMITKTALMFKVKQGDFYLMQAGYGSPQEKAREGLLT